MWSEPGEIWLIIFIEIWKRGWALSQKKLFSQPAVREAALAKYSDRHDPAGLEYFFNFITYGAYRVICVWLNREDREPPQQIARQMIRFIRMEQT